MTETTTAPDGAALADRAERIVDVLRHRDPVEADAQVCSMVIAGLRGLSELRGPDAVCAFLVQAGPIMAGHHPGGPMEHASAAAEPAPSAPPATALPSHEDLVAHGLAYLRGLPLDAAMAKANAAMEIGGAFLHQVFSDMAPAATPMAPADAASAEVVAAPMPQPDPSAAPAPQPENRDAPALALLDQLRGLAPDQGHEQACAAIAGACAYLIERAGPAYTAAVCEGLQANAVRHIEVWGASPRPDGVPLH